MLDALHPLSVRSAARNPGREVGVPAVLLRSALRFFEQFELFRSVRLHARKIGDEALPRPTRFFPRTESFVPRAAT